MSDTVIAPDLKFDYEWAKDNADRRKFYGSEIVKLIERVSKAEEENVALRAKVEQRDNALEQAAKDCLNPEGTYGEAKKRVALIREWLVIGERERKANAAVAARGREGE